MKAGFLFKPWKEKEDKKVSNADLLAVMLIGFALLCFVRASRGSFNPGFGFAYINPVRLKESERRTYFALGMVLTTAGIWILVR